MKVSFFHDHRFVVYQNIYYTYGGLPATVWQRYLDFFDEVIVATRCKKIEEKPNKLTVSSSEKVFFEPVHDLIKIQDILFKYNKINKHINIVLQKTDCAIIRLPSTIGLVACRAAIKMQKPWAVEVVGCAWDAYWNHGNIIGKLIAPLMDLLNRHYVKKAPYALYVTQEFLQKRYPCSGVMGNGLSNVIISMPDISVLENRLMKIETLDLTEPIYLGLIGSMKVAYKGHEAAIKAIAELKKSPYDVHLRCIGDGDKAKWVKLATDLGVLDKIEFCGMLASGQSVLHWLDDLDIYIMPSLTEGLPRSMIEAMSRGCPSLGSFEGGGMPELLQPEYLFNARNYKQIAQKVESMIVDKKKLKACAERNFVVTKKYSKEVLDNQRNQLYREFAHFCKKEMEK